MVKIDHNLGEASAEMLMNYLYPELEEKWEVQNMGIFYRNYSQDELAYDNQSAEIQLARDGFIKLLPQGMLFQTDKLKRNDRKKEIREQNARLKLLQDLFQPFDTFAFRSKLAVERQVSGLLDSKLHYLLSTYFHFDLQSETNPYVKEAAVLLPFISKKRGDFLFVRNLLEALFDCRVMCFRGRYSQTDTTRSWLPMITYELLMEHLTGDEYNRMAKDLNPFVQFIAEWFIPFDVKCRILIKWHQQTPLLSRELLLDYNSELTK